MNPCPARARGAAPIVGPMASRLPTKPDDVLGQGPPPRLEGALRALVDARGSSSIILRGPAGTGKTTIARLLAEAVGAAFESLKPSQCGCEGRPSGAAEKAREWLARTAFDRCCCLTRSTGFPSPSRTVASPSVEDGNLTLVGATTENPLVLRGQRPAAQPFHPVPPRAPGPSGLAHAARPRSRVRERHHRRGRGRCHRRLRHGDGRALLTTLEVALAIAGEGATSPSTTSSGPGRPGR